MSCIIEDTKKPLTETETAAPDHQRRQADILKGNKAAHKDEQRSRRKKRGGLVLVYTGNGKGKTSAALGLIGRALGHRQTVAVVQFVKGRWISGERKFWQRYADHCHGVVHWHTMGEGFSWVTQDRDTDQLAAQRAWDQAREFLGDTRVDLVILDEINIVLNQELLAIDDVLASFRGRPAGQNVVATGRHAHGQLLAMADMVSEIVAHRHHSQAGYGAQPGVEF